MKVCSVDDCGREHYAKGLCRAHYRRAQRGAASDAPIKAAPKRAPKEPVKPAVCALSGCEREVLARGLCSAHYQAQRLQDPAALQVHRENTRRWIAQNPVRHKKSQRETMRKRHTGFSHELVLRLRDLQQGCCAVCKVQLLLLGKTGRSECADHYETVDGIRVPHKTPGAVKVPRGLLCVACNIGLAQYEAHQRPAGLRLEPYEVYLSNPPVAQLAKAAAKAA